MPTEEFLHRTARERAERQAGFRVHLAIYVMANFLLVVVWWMTGGITIGLLPRLIPPAGLGHRARRPPPCRLSQAGLCGTGGRKGV
ncbi:MAG: 2TM domain-containing protein [Methanomicrobiaceae archaeon]|nr:2TM domain-containing protein [Methanomicrobiaceae archaeon]